LKCNDSRLSLSSFHFSILRNLPDFDRRNISTFHFIRYHLRLFIRHRIHQDSIGHIPSSLLIRILRSSSSQRHMRFEDTRYIPYIFFIFTIHLHTFWIPNERVLFVSCKALREMASVTAKHAIQHHLGRFDFFFSRGQWVMKNR
jgi:hypothetical protein